ncbi:MAG TPA: aldo/keto reductase [Acidimicrobiales bacterium]
MEARKLGHDGPELSVVGLGCNNFGMRIDAEASHAVVRAALDAGVTHFDTAEMYGGGRSEEFLGQALGSRRDEAVVATKYLPRPKDEPYRPGVLAERIRTGCEISLRRLGTDRIDVYYLHFPDPEAPMEEAQEALAALVEEGKVLHLASSNLSGDQIREADEIATDRGLPRFTGTQIEWNLLQRAVEESVVPAAREAGLGIVPYFPLASGLLTGKYKRGEAYPPGSRLAVAPHFAADVTDETFDRIERLAAFAAEHGRTLLELAVAWLAAQPGVASVIAGATSPAQVEANARAASWRLTDDDLAAIDAL